MGYTTDFFGAFEITPTLTPEHNAYLTAFANTRRMKRNADIAATLPDPIREAAGLPVGADGAYFVGGDGFKGQEGDASVTDHNRPPGQPSTDEFSTGINEFKDWYPAYSAAVDKAVENGAQPGLWCQWVPNEDGTYLEWDEGEKFYEYVPWLRYLITNFFEPWGYTLNGEVEWSGEEMDDRGLIRVKDNKVAVLIGKVVYQ